MNCHECEARLLRDPDDLGSATERAALAAHLAACPSCRHLQATLPQISALLLAEAASVPVPDAETEWRRLRGRLHPDQAPPVPSSRRPLASWIWWGAPLAAAAALLFAFILQTPSRPPGGFTAAPPVADAAIITSAEYVEPGDANASTMVYVDKQSGWLVVWAADATPAKG